MTTPFADLFAESESSSIEVAGEQLYAVVTIELVAPVTLTVFRLKARTDRPEGLVLDAGRTHLTVGAATAPRVTLWSDTAPKIVNVRVGEPDGPTTLRLWNTWRDSGLEQAWLGWAAMKRSDVAGTVTLNCRDGHDDGDFDDLVVEVTYGSTEDSGVLTTAFQ